MLQRNRLFTGAGAKFFASGDQYNMDVILRKSKNSLPSLNDTAWKHVFVQIKSVFDKEALTKRQMFVRRVWS